MWGIINSEWEWEFLVQRGSFGNLTVGWQSTALDEASVSKSILFGTFRRIDANDEEDAQ